LIFKPELEKSCFLIKIKMTSEINTSSNLEIATLGAGCFWCVDTLFQDLRGVSKVESGYMGGKTTNPTYREICTGMSGHAEIVQVTFDPKIITFAELCEVFFTIHDPTTLNRQGADAGTQYRSVIFYHDEIQKETAEKAKIAAKDYWDDPIVTEISAATTYYVAEKYHQNYYKLNPYEGYCQIVIAPKVRKFKKEFFDKLKVG
jgi:peptide-methionine (S)-S-oxide reductase